MPTAAWLPALKVVVALSNSNERNDGGAQLPNVTRKLGAKFMPLNLQTSASQCFFAMDGARLITGETLYIDGGYHIID